MAETLTSAQMRAVETAAIAAHRATGRELMERAGQGAAEIIATTWPDARAALILCGPGNNGGDGYVVARALATRGWRVTICATRPADGLPPDARENALLCADLPILDWSQTAIRDGLASGTDPVVVVDALLGIGQTRDSTALLAPWHAARDALCGAPPPHTVSLDLPTGYDSDSGERRANIPFDADLVLPFHAEKPVHQILRNQGVKVVVVDIGLRQGETE